MVNKAKLAVFFSANCSDVVKDEVHQRLGITNEALGEKYLRLPTTLGRSTKEAFEHIPNKIRSLMGGWSENKLSCAGREILIKSVVQAVPTYSMSCFQLSVATYKKIMSYISNFCWGSVVDSRKIHWHKWEDLTRCKLKGGLGFRDLQKFNIAMLGKQGRQLLSNPDSLCARVLKGKYYLNGRFLSAKKKHSSHTWRELLVGRKVLVLGLIRRIGDGTSTNIWEDKWIPEAVNHKPLCRLPSAIATKVSELISNDNISWNLDAIHANFIPIDFQAISCVPLRTLEEDVWAWSAESMGITQLCRCTIYCWTSIVASKIQK